MKNLLLSTLLTTLMLIPALAHSADYIIDNKGAHASINFKVSHLGYSFIQGRFNKFEGIFSYDPNNIEAAGVAVSIDTQSLDSNHAERDRHLKSDNFINAAKFSSAKFVSTKVTPTANGAFTIAGNLTLHGITKNIVIDAHLIGAGSDPWGGQRAGFQGTTRLQLAEFAIPVMGASSYVDMELHIEGIAK